MIFEILNPLLLVEYKKIVTQSPIDILTNLEKIDTPVDYFQFYNSVSSVYSSKIEGENIDFSNISTQVSNNATSLININTASLAELETLPSVGQVTAQAIIEARPYKKIEDLMNVKGIGETTFSKLKDKICV